MKLKELIGKRGKKVFNTVERGAVKKFSHAIGDEHPIFVDPEYGKNSRHGENIAPVTFPVTLEHGRVEELKLGPGIIHGEQRYQYERPLRVGEELYCYSEIKDVYERAGRSGSMIFIETDSIGEDADGNRIYTATGTMIINETVRKGLGL